MAGPQPVVLITTSKSTLIQSFLKLQELCAFSLEIFIKLHHTCAELSPPTRFLSLVFAVKVMFVLCLCGSLHMVFIVCVCVCVCV